MNDNSLRRVGGTCSVLVGVCNVVIGVLFLMLPADQKPGTSLDVLLPAVARDPTLLQIYYLVFAAGAVLALGAVPAISESVRAAHAGWVRWTTNLAFIGFAVVAIDCFQIFATQVPRAAAYMAGDASTRAAMQATSRYLDPQGWLAFGAVGAWILAASLLALRGSLWPKGLAYVGIAVAMMEWLVVVSLVFNLDFLLIIVGALGGVVLGPVWYIGVGLALRRGPQTASTRAPLPAR